MAVDREQLARETVFTAELSSKKGGQHVNKVSTRARLFFNIEQSVLFSGDEKARIHNKLARRINSEGLLIVSSQEERSLLQNKERALEKLAVLLENALVVKPRRKKTVVPRGVREKRLESKKKKSDIKRNRRKDSLY